MTAINPLTTAADLRNAAMIMDTLGFGRGFHICPASARVCMDGALKLATYSKLTIEQKREGRAFVHNVFYETFKYDGFPRYQAAVTAINNVLGKISPASPVDDPTHVHYYNDYICDGGDQAIETLILAANWIEKNNVGALLDELLIEAETKPVRERSPA